ncbi:MAG TPA: rRNA adenine N-6-methyltransferase family protein [Acidimicrobiales bacterium]|nr:rRNA adenine N-6-methyltransferase family protein [Acidimicrobiales bacterium]
MAARQPARWGWHELDSSCAARLVADAGVRRGDLVIDVGAGAGALVGPLLAAGARVIAVELHPRRRQMLRARFEGERVVVVAADATDLRLPFRPFKVVANPPFAITTALIRRLLAPGSRLVRADLLVPAHVARRWTAEKAPSIGRWGAEFEAECGRRLPRHAFTPPATTDVRVLTIRRRYLPET